MLSEFELINLFRDIGSEYYEQNGIVLSPGDDCAIIDLPKPLITSVDASVADIHFPSNASPIDIGYRSVAVALSDLAAMGCFPRAFSLSVTSPINDKEWYIKLSKGVKEIADEFEISLIGGDITKGPLNLNVIVYGTPYDSKVLKRSTAKVGDNIYISSQVGRAKKGLSDFMSNDLQSEFIKDYFRPLPKIKLGKDIINIASACIDTSDGLLADLKNILKSSEVGAIIFLDDIPITSDIEDINAGDDYDLCFTMPNNIPSNNFYKIGVVAEGNEIKLVSDKGYDIDIKGFDHFNNE